MLNPDADPDPAWHFDADPDPVWHFDAVDADPDPDPTLIIKAQNLKSAQIGSHAINHC